MPKAAKKTYSDMQQQIAALTEQAEKLRADEKREVVGKIKEAISVYGITPEELFGKAGNAGKKTTTKAALTKSGNSRKASRPYSKVAAKYKDGVGNTWSGRGSKPRWLTSAISGGKSLEDFAV